MPALSGRARATMRTTGSVTHDTKRLIGIGQFGRRSARRVSGFTKQGTGPTFGQRSFWKRRYEDSDSPSPSAAPTCCSHVRNSTSPRPCRCRSGATMTSMPHDPPISVPSTDTVTGIAAYWPTMVGPSRATQMVGPAGGQLGLRVYCHSHRSRLPSAASAPNTRRYMAVI